MCANVICNVFSGFWQEDRCRPRYFRSLWLPECGCTRGSPSAIINFFALPLPLPLPLHIYLHLQPQLQNQSPEVPLTLISTFALREMAVSINRDSQRCRQQPQLPSDNEIIDTCDRNPPCHENGDSIKGLMYPPEAPIFWIKYGLRSAGRDAEARAHDFAFRALEQIPQSEREGIRIPEIYRIFTIDDPSGESMVYIVMEYVPGKTLLQILCDTPNQRLEHLYDHIAKAIKLLLSFEVPYDATPGPYGGGIIKHPLFKDYQANIEYSSVAQLQHHINKVRPIQFRV
jgi:hypothetical protein